MDRYVGSNYKNRRRAVLIAAGALVVLGLVAVGFLFIPFPVTVDGATVGVRAGAPVSDLVARHLIKARSGDLLSVKSKKVVRAGGGAAAVVYVGDEKATMTTPVWPLATVRSVNGGNVTEKTVTSRRAIPIESEFVGHGPIVYMSQPGNVGLKEQRRGEVSGELVTSRTLIASQPAVFLRTSYTGGGKKIALTFDDGPWPGNTEKILKILKKYNVKATFFMMGANVHNHPELAKAVADAGMDIGNHSETHKQLTKLNGKQIAWEIEAAQRMIRNKTGKTPTWFRPPYGAVNRAVYSQASADKVKVVLWGVDTNDWRKPPVTQIIDTTLREVKPGAVILMHDGGGNRAKTIEALPGIITRLHALGYQFVTLDELDNKRKG